MIGAEVFMKRPQWTVRTRILVAVLTLTFLTLAIVGTTTFIIERRQILERIDDDLQISTEQFAALAQDRFEAETFDTLDALMEDSLTHTVPRDNEGAVAFVGDKPVWTQPGGLEMEDDPKLMSFLQMRVRALAGADGEIDTLSTDQSRYRFAVMPVKLGDLGEGAYVIAYDLEDGLESLWETLRVFVIASILGLMVLGFFAWLIAGELLRPVRKLTDTASRITNTDLSTRIDVDSRDDLGKMARTFNSMLDRLEDAFSSQMTLLDDAGHELRTPITIMRGHIELMDPADEGDVRQVKELALDELDRMHRLADDLVLLAKAKRPDFIQTAPTDIGPFIDKIATLGDALGAQQVVVDSRPEAVADIDEQRLTQALIQLIANASKFSPPESTIRLGCEDGDDMKFWVADSGRGMDPSQISTIFERFGRLDPSTEGTGLGLTIVAAIVDQHGGSIDVQSAPGRGTTMTLTIPKDQS